MRWIAFVILFAAGSGAAAILAFDAGRQAAQRECPKAQHGQRLLSTEQRAASTLCTYASGWDGYGKMIKRKSNSGDKT